jgi:uncharacterized protein YciI
MKKGVFGLLLLAATVFFGCKEEGEHKDHQDDDLYNEIHVDSDADEKSMAKQIKELKDGGYEIFDYVREDTGDTIIMQQYFMAFLKRGPNNDLTKKESDSLQELHMAHLSRMYEEGYADISGPFGDDQDVRGITVYNVPTLKMADSLANMDPSVQAGSLMIEVRPWWAGKGFPLR